MDKTEFANLDIGDLVRARWNGEIYVIVATIGHDTYIVDRTLTATNPSEWDLIKRHRVTSCAEGLHVPAKMMPDGLVLCQNCAKELTDKDYDKYHSKRKELSDG